MSDSLQDQLLALGLAKEKPRDKADGKRRGNAGGKKKNRKGSRGSGAGKAGGLSLEQAYAAREREEKDQARKARQRKLAEDRRRREINLKIRTIVEPNRLNDEAADQARNFLYKGRIRKIHVTADQLKALNAGQLGVVYLAGGYHLLAPEHVESVRALSPEHVPDLGGGESGDEEEFPVPDDLSW
jgi:uncharacterized protein YaiL (DUF2058 family)